MKVFVVINESVYQAESYIFVKVFSNYKSAKKYFDDTVKESKENDNLKHINISIDEQEIID